MRFYSFVSDGLALQLVVVVVSGDADEGRERPLSGPDARAPLAAVAINLLACVCTPAATVIGASARAGVIIMQVVCSRRAAGVASSIARNPINERRSVQINLHQINLPKSRQPLSRAGSER